MFGDIKRAQIAGYFDLRHKAGLFHWCGVALMVKYVDTTLNTP